LRYACTGFSNVAGQDSNTLTLPVMINCSPCFTPVAENFTSCQATVFILKKPSCARSPCAKTTPAVPRMNSGASMGAKTRVSILVCRIVVPPFP